MTAHSIVLVILAVLLTSGCGGAGLGSDVRKDIEKQMETTREMVTACYTAALDRDRKLKGTLTVQVKTDPKTGAFTRTRIKDSTLGDKSLEECVIGSISKLKLDKPTSTSVEADYPIQFRSKK